jgi:hypothetical protein
MAINFNAGTQIEGVGQIIEIPNRVVQFVPNFNDGSWSFTTAAWTNTIATSIVVQSGNKIMVEYLMNDRSDQGNGTWSLIYHRILVNGSQIMYSGYNGAAANHIGFYSRTFMYTPPSAGTYTFQAQNLSYQGTSYSGRGNSNAFNAAHLNLYEMGG